MRLHYLQHVAFENPGCILDWAKEKKFSISRSLLYQNEPLPNVDDFDLLVVMGGPMGANDDHLYPWMRPEKKLIEQAIHSGKKVIGICLGAQIVANVLGQKVYRNSEKEIGWFPIEWTEAALSINALNHLPKFLTVFHWHGDTFDVPPGALHLAKSQACKNQAFLFEDNVLAFQFHLEVKPDNVRAMVENCGDELAPAPFIQTHEEILAGVRYCQAVNEHIQTVLDKFAAR